MTEWLKVPVLKTGVGTPTVGSNPTLSAMLGLLEPSVASVLPRVLLYKSNVAHHKL